MDVVVSAGSSHSKQARKPIVGLFFVSSSFFVPVFMIAAPHGIRRSRRLSCLYTRAIVSSACLECGPVFMTETVQEATDV